MSQKPVPKKTRLVPPYAGPCPFCAMSSDASDGLYILSDGSSSRDLLQSNLAAFATSNRWGVFPGSELVIPYRHVYDLESLKDQEAVDLLLLKARYDRAPGAAAFINVGVQAGSSIAHIHAQVVRSPLFTSELFPATPSREALEEGFKAATNLNLVFAKDGKSLGYVAPSPVTSGELRIIAPDVASVVGTFLPAIRKAALLGPWSYNLVGHFTPDGCLLQWLPALDPGVVFPRFLRTVVSTIDQRVYSDILSASWKP